MKPGIHKSPISGSRIGGDTLEGMTIEQKRKEHERNSEWTMSDLAETRKLLCDFHIIDKDSRGEWYPPSNIKTKDQLWRHQSKLVREKLGD